jgi:hypothetical protein
MSPPPPIFGSSAGTLLRSRPAGRAAPPFNVLLLYDGDVVWGHYEFNLQERDISHLGYCPTYVKWENFLEGKRRAASKDLINKSCGELSLLVQPTILCVF